MSKTRPGTLIKPRPMIRSYSKAVSNIRSSDSEFNKSAKSVSQLKPLHPHAKPKAKPSPAKVTVPPPLVSVFQSLLNPVNANVNQTFHTLAEPSPESSEPVASIDPPLPWNDQPQPTLSIPLHWSNAFSKFKNLRKPLTSPVQSSCTYTIP